MAPPVIYLYNSAMNAPIPAYAIIKSYVLLEFDFIGGVNKHSDK